MEQQAQRTPRPEPKSEAKGGGGGGGGGCSPEDIVAALEPGDGGREAVAGEGAPVGRTNGRTAVGGRAARLDLHHVLHLPSLCHRRWTESCMHKFFSVAAVLDFSLPGGR
jgi:hypothetical protein